MPHVLIIDEEDDAREILCKFLTRTGHDVIGVGNGEEGLQRALARMPDLIVLDLLMPGMDGPNFLGVLRSYRRLGHVPVIVLTAAPDSPKADAAAKLGINGLLPKARVTLEEIDHAITQTLGAA